jgi:two-component system nitrogen regulation response regulator NtrX
MPRVLIIDDEADYREQLEIVLDEAGYDVSTAGNASEAMKACRSSAPPDLLVADWMIRSDLDGLDLAKTCRKMHDQVAVVIMTGHPPAQLKARMAAVPDAVLLEKPFGTQKLLDAAGRALANVGK